MTLLKKLLSYLFLKTEKDQDPPPLPLIATSLKKGSLGDIPQLCIELLDENKVIAQEAASKITQLITHNYAKINWSAFDQSCRYILPPERLKIFASPKWLAHVQDCSSEEKAHIFGIISMNANGYLREEALNILTHLPTPAIIPYIILRLNDWVPPIRTQALIGCQHRLFTFHPTDLIRNFTLMRWLRLANRANLSPFQKGLYDYISAPNFRKEIFPYLRTASVKENLFYWDLLKGHLTTSPDLLTPCLTNKHPEVRCWLLNTLPHGKHLQFIQEQLLQDSSIRVQYAALRSIPQQYRANYRPSFEKSLIHKSKKIREYSRFVLSSLEYHDFRNIYKNMLNTTPPKDHPRALAGWCEVAIYDDLPPLQELLTHSHNKVRLTAFQAFARLEVTKNPDPYLVGIRDNNAKVRSICVKELQQMAYVVQEQMASLLQTPHPKIQPAALMVLSGLRPPEVLKYIFVALIIWDQSLKYVAWNALHRWYSRYYVRPYFKITPPLHGELTALYQKIDKENSIPLEFQGLWYGLNGFLKMFQPKEFNPPS